MAAVSDKAIKTEYAENKYRFNDGTELQNKEFADGTGLEMYDAGFRIEDPQLGRFTQIDPLAEEYAGFSTYAYCMNNPVLYVDPQGLRVDAATAIAQLLASPNGGYWNSEDGEVNDFQSQDEAFGYGAYQISIGGGWGSVPGMATSFDQALSNYNYGFITPGIAQALFAITWGSTNQATNVTAKYAVDGFDIGGIATSDGGAITDYFVSTDFVKSAFENLGEGDPNADNESGELMETFYKGNEFLDKGFTANDLMSNINKISESEVVEHTATIVSLIGAAHNIGQGIDGFQHGNISTGIYKTVVGGGTLGILGAIAVGVLAPEALLVWGAAALVSDTIIGMNNGKSFSQALLGN